MRRVVLLSLTIALAVLVFAPVAVAEAEDPAMDDHMTDDRAMDDDMMASPASSASASPMSSATASASAMSSASASATSSAGASASPTASPSASASAEMLPDTGGLPLRMILLSLGIPLLLVGWGLASTGLVRRM